MLHPSAEPKSHRLATGGRTRHSAAAFTMVEIVVTVALVAVTFVAVMNTVGASRTTLFRVGERTRATALAHDLMQEILSQPYRDPTNPESFGPTSTEAATGDRSRFDDVDDYDDWRASPPQDPDGNALGEQESFERRASVTFVEADTLQPTESETGMKQITVTVSRGGEVAAQVTALRARGLHVEDLP